MAVARAGVEAEMVEQLIEIECFVSNGKAREASRKGPLSRNGDKVLRSWYSMG
jgi:hypothetical protein